jgi:biopolymer transport protein TolR
MGAMLMEKEGGARGAAARRAKPMSEINVTPFVDVMLVLLIIFMVAAPMLTVGVPVELPRTAASALPAEQEEPLTVTLTADGRGDDPDHRDRPGELIPRLRRSPPSGPTTRSSCAPMAPSPMSGWCR